jgi:hypothetical protein
MRAVFFVVIRSWYDDLRWIYRKGREVRKVER